MIHKEYADLICNNTMMSKMFYIICIEKLSLDGYCNLNKLISGKYNIILNEDQLNSSSDRVRDLYYNVFPKVPIEGIKIISDYYNQFKLDDYYPRIHI